MALNHQRHTDKWWETEYSNNIHSYLQYHEVKWRMVYGARSPQIHLRPVLLKTIRNIAKTCEMSNVCVHLAVTLMDLFMDNHDLKFDTIMLVAFACLTLAAKIEEHCLKVPKLNTMQNVISKDVTNSHFRKVEMKILMFFEFNVAIPTVAHFIEFYKDHFFCDNDFYHNEFACILKDKFNRMILSYQDASLESIKLISYNPSMVAASIILTTRHTLGLVPCWTVQLRKVTGYLKKDLVQCCSLLGRNVMQHRKFVPMDEGYLSSSPGFRSPIIMGSKKKRSHIDVPNALNHQRHTDKWWETEYSNNIHSYLQYHKVKWRVVYGARSPQIHLRPVLLKTIRNIAKTCEMSNVCVHLAVTLMDLFMDNHDLKFDSMMLVAFACLTLAAKIEEHCLKIPKLNTVQNVISKDVTNSHFRKVEMKILMFFEFNVAIPTVAHFIEIYKDHFFCDNDFYHNEFPCIFKDKFNRMILSYQDASLESIKLISYNPSMVAASIILTTRHTLGLVPCWTVQLCKVTGYLKKDLVQCCSLLGRNVMQHRKFVPMDEGYLGSSPGFRSPIIMGSKKKRSHIDVPNALNHQRHTDKWWETEYSNNIHSYLQYHKVKWRVVYGARSPQIHLRPVLLKTIRNIAKTCEMSNVCVHLAVTLMDLFMDNHDLKFDSMMLVAFACLTLAAKIEEHCLKIPKLNTVQNVISKDVTNSHFRKVEMKILMFFEFNVAIPTVAHFIEIYKDHFFCDNDFYHNEFPCIFKDKFNRMILSYQDASLESIKLISYNPSMVAASIILTTRHTLGLVPCWTVQLCKVTGYLKKDLVQCCSLLGRNVMQHRKFVPMDEGYLGSSPGFRSPIIMGSKKKRSHIDVPNALNHQRHTDKWWETEYSNNIHSYLQYHKVKWRVVYGARSPQIHLRPVLLKTIRNIAKTCEMSNVCVHLAVTLMDLFMDNHDLKFDSMMLVAFACLTLAAKIEEHCLKIPKLNTVQNVISKDVTNSHFRKVEMKILMFFEFNVAIPTVAHFIEIYKDHFFCDNDFYHNEFPCIFKDKFNRMILSYQDASLESIKLISYNPSMVAASIILTTRHTLGLVPCWTVQLCKVTGYLKKDLVQCCSLLGRNVMQHRKFVPMDEGYLGSSPGFRSPIIMGSKKKRSHIDVPNALNHQRHTDKWWETEYSNNIHSYLQYHKVKWRVVYGARSPQIHLRPVLLKTIRNIAKTCEMSNVCVHLAVTLMDLFMDNHDLKFDSMMLVAFACLTLAAKIEEHCLKIPKLNTVQNVISKDVTNSHFRKVEMKILMFFEFNVAIPTVAHFIEIYKDHFFCDNDFYHNEFPCIFKDKFNRMILSYQDASLESIKLISYNPSMVAASIILTTRHTLGLVPCWTVQLCKVTGYLKKDLVQCCSLLGRNVMQHRKFVPMDEGYLGSSPGFRSPIIMGSKKKRSHIDVPNALNHQRHTDKWWETEYSNNIHSYLQYHKVKWRVVYGARSPQIHLRPVLLKTIRNIAKTCEMSNVCVHLAVTLMDLFMDNHDLKFDSMMLVAFACLTLAAKIEEHCLKIPKLNTVQNVISKDVTNSHFRKVEMKILMFFEFNVAIPTVAHFIEIYKDHFFCDNDFYHNEFPCIFKDKFNRMILSYQDASLESIKLISYNPSMVAASIILTTRHTLGLVPCWTVQLCKVTGYLKKDLVQCCSLLGRNVMQHRKFVPMDEGYLGSSPGFRSPIIMGSKKKRSHIDVPNALNHQRHTDKWWETEYSNNIHSYLQYHKVKWRVVYGARSPQIHLRPVLLKTIRNIAKTCEMSNVCVHLAVTLMDLFMDNHDLKFDSMMLVAFACLTLAAKIEEHCLKIPKLNTVQNVISKDVTNSHFRKVEMKILMFFEFNVAIPTVAHFIEIYKDHFFCDNDFYHNEFPCIFKDKFNRMILSYQDASLESIKLISYNPSMVAASIILTTRHTLGLVPCWTVQLCKVTGYLKKDLVQCCSLLGRNVMQHRKFVPMDERYLGSSPGFRSPIIMGSKKKRSHIDVPNVILSKLTAF